MKDNITYDFSRCNNLQWKMMCTSGFLKVDDSNIVLCYDTKIIDDKTGMERYMVNSSFHINQADSFLKTHEDFIIVPRSSSTYDDYKCGDTVRNMETDNIGKVEARIDNMICIHWGDGDNEFEWITCNLAFSKNYRLINTDYEIELIGEKFNPEDKVLVRYSDNDSWKMRFYSYSLNALFFVHEEKSLTSPICGYEQCIPYNEKTWRLLGTTDKYNKTN